MRRPSFFVVFGARFMQGIGLFITLYGLFVSAIASGISGGISSTWLIPLVGLVLLIWGSKILHDRGIDFTLDWGNRRY